MKRISFQTSLLFAPLAYAVHHLDEHIIFNFREWRTRYFPDNNQIPTEVVVCLLVAITLVYLILHATCKTRASALSVLLFLAASQVANVIYHVGGTIVFRDFSPGTITAILLYVPVNLLIFRKAFEEEWINWRSGTVLFLLGGALFASFEAFGPLPSTVMLLSTWVWIGLSGNSYQTDQPVPGDADR